MTAHGSQITGALPALAEPLADIWFDGFASGTVTGCGMFLPADKARAEGAEIVHEVLESPDFPAQVRHQVEGRLQTLLHTAGGSGSRLSLTDLFGSAWADGFISGITTGCDPFVPPEDLTATANNIAEAAYASSEMCSQISMKFEKWAQSEVWAALN